MMPLEPLSLAVLLGEGPFTIEAIMGSLKEMYKDYIGAERIHITANHIFFNLGANRITRLQLNYAWFHWWSACSGVSAVIHQRRDANWHPIEEDLLRMLPLMLTSVVIFYNQFADPWTKEESKRQWESMLSFGSLTLIYFLITQYSGKAGQNTKLVTQIRDMYLYVLEGLEEWWIPTLIRMVSTSMAVVVAVFTLLYGYWIVATLMAFNNIYVSTLHVYRYCWRPLQERRLDKSKFPILTHRQLKQRDELRCPVCRENLRPLRTRMTPCKHVIDVICLGQCKDMYGKCPVCKQPI